jgi:hypothetical protein
MPSWIAAKREQLDEKLPRLCGGLGIERQTASLLQS